MSAPRLTMLLAFSLAPGSLTASTPRNHHSTVSRPQPALLWEQAFADRSGMHPVHFTGSYTDAHGGAHRVEEWRVGTAHLRRRTDNRIDLHADQPLPPPHRRGTPAIVPPGYLWNVVDLEKGVDHRINSAALEHAGPLYNFYAMAHGLSRPPGTFRITRLSEQAPIRLGGVSCEWFELTPDAQPGTHICWSAEIGAPLKIEGLLGTAWQTTFQMQALDRDPISPAIFHVDTAGLEVREMDQMQADD